MSAAYKCLEPHVTLALADMTPLQHTLDASKLAEIAERMRQGLPLVPVLVNHVNGGYLIRDGHHKAEAARRLGIARVPARVVSP